MAEVRRRLELKFQRELVQKKMAQSFEDLPEERKEQLREEAWDRQKWFRLVIN